MKSISHDPSNDNNKQHSFQWKTVSFPMLVIEIGIWLLILAFGADLLGISSKEGFGPQQMFIAILGGILFAGGIGLDYIRGTGVVKQWLHKSKFILVHPGKAILGAVQIGLLIFIIQELKLHHQMFFSVLLTLFTGILLHYALKKANGNDAPVASRAEKKSSSQSFSGISVAHYTILIVLVSIFLYKLADPTVYSQLDLKVQNILHNIVAPRMSKWDVANLERGYYENLVRPSWFGDQFSQSQKRPRHWMDAIQATKAGRSTNDFLKIELRPSSETLFLGMPFHTNRWGMRDKDYEKTKPPDTYRIALAGPSHAMGLGVGDNETFEWVLEDMLNNTPTRSQSYEILNFSISDFTILHLPLFLKKKIVAFEPDALFYVAHIDKYWAIFHLAERFKNGIDIPYEFIQEIMAKAGITREMEVLTIRRKLNPYAREILSWAYRSTIEICRQYNIKPVWIYLPLVGDTGREEDAAEQIELAREAGFTVISLADVYQNATFEEIWLGAWDHHPNGKGHRLIAERLYSELLSRDATLSLGLNGGSREYSRSASATTFGTGDTGGDE